MRKFTSNLFKNSHIVTLLLLAAMMIVFTVKGTFFLDPDFGWRLRSGGYFLSYGIPKSDIYTYTMPSFPWVDHAWMFDVLIAALFPVIGMLGLSLIIAAVAFIALLLSVSGNRSFLKERLVKFKMGQLKINIPLDFTFFLAFFVLLPFFGVRAQIISWVLFSLLQLVLLNKSSWQRFRIFVPLYFFFWANMHGGFASGLIALLIVLLLRSYRLRKILWKDLFILILSTGATLINPYGAGLWREVWSSMADTSLRFRIIEWKPAIFFPEFSYFLLLVLSTFLLIRYRKKFAIEKLGLFFIFTLFGLSSVRNVPFWLITALPLTLSGVHNLYKEAKTYPHGAERFATVYKIFWGISILIAVLQLAMSVKTDDNMSNDNFYPGAAIKYLQSNELEGEMLSVYEWGGYLIWKYPERKVFIDGRMPSWKRESAPVGELVSAFDTYNDLLAGEVDYKKVFEEFDIRLVMLPIREKGNSDTLEKKARNFLKLFNILDSDFNLMQALKDDGWREVYSDDTSKIFLKPNN